MKPKRIILILLIIALLIPMAVSCAPEKDVPLTSDLWVSRSNLIASDGWAYYSTAEGLHKVRPNGEDKTLVLDIVPRTYYIYENRIYYIPREEGEGTVYSIYSDNTDGSDKQFICEAPLAVPSGAIMQMEIINGWIYLGLAHERYKYNLYRMNLDGSGMTMINPSEETFYDYSIDGDGWIYYVILGEFENGVGGQLWRMHYDGTNKHPLMQEVGWAIDYYDNEIYYCGMDDNIIYAVSFFGTEKRKIAEVEWIIWFVKVIGDWVYYRDASDFYKVRTDGSEHTKITVKSGPSNGKMRVVDNWLTYLSEDRIDIEMVRISDKYDTDDLFDWIYADQLESILRYLNTDDPFDQRRAERYKEYEIRKYE